MADTATPRTSSNPSSFGDLTNPSTWMALASDKTKLTAWYQSLSPKAPADLVAYYVDKTYGQPGANATEQAGSAKYWADKFTSDPKSLASTGTVLGAGGSGASGAGTAVGGAGGAGRAIPDGAPIVGTAVYRGTQLGGNAGDTYGAAYLAAQLQRRKSQAGGRGATIFAGFAPGAPTTQPATALGARY